MHLHAHDLVLQSWIERGLVGACISIGLIVLIAYRAFGIITTTGNGISSVVQIGAVGAVIAALCQNIADYTLWFAPITLLFWLAIALVNSPKTTEYICNSTSTITKIQASKTRMSAVMRSSK
jgi:O-antigen ligase